METLDAVAASILGLAALRGLWLGGVREAFSLAALGAAVLAAFAFGDDARALVAGVVGDDLPPLVIRVAATGAVSLAALLVVAGIGRFVGRSVRLAGLGGLDRLAGAGLGALEGAVVVAVGLWAATTLLSNDHPLLAESRAVALYEQLAQGATATDARDVAAPGGAARR